MQHYYPGSNTAGVQPYVVVPPNFGFRMYGPQPQMRPVGMPEVTQPVPPPVCPFSFQFQPPGVCGNNSTQASHAIPQVHSVQGPMVPILGHSHPTPPLSRGTSPVTFYNERSSVSLGHGSGSTVPNRPSPPLLCHSTHPSPAVSAASNPLVQVKDNKVCGSVLSAIKTQMCSRPITGPQDEIVLQQDDRNISSNASTTLPSSEHVLSEKDAKPADGTSHCSDAMNLRSPKEWLISFSTLNNVNEVKSDGFAPPKKTFSSCAKRKSGEELFQEKESSSFCADTAHGDDIVQREGNNSTCKTASSLNPDVKEFIPKGFSSLPPESDKPNVASTEDDGHSSPKPVEKKENSLKLLSEKAPFLFQLPPKPRLMRQLSRSALKSTQDSETQTENCQEKGDEKLCAACQQRLGSRSAGFPISANVKSMSREHKVKYVAFQAGLMVRENPSCLAEDSELTARLKARLHTMCRQFGSQGDDISDLEDDLICKIAVSILQEQQELASTEKRDNFFCHLSAEVDVQLEIAHELLADDQVEESQAGLEQASFPSAITMNDEASRKSGKDEYEIATKFSPPLASVSTVAYVVSPVQHAQTLTWVKPSPTVISMSDKPRTFPDYNIDNSATLPGPESFTAVKACESQTLDEIMKCNPQSNQASEIPDISIVSKPAVPPGLPASLNLAQLDPRHQEEAAKLLKLQQVYLQNLLKMKMAPGTVPTSELAFGQSQNRDLLQESSKQFISSQVQNAALDFESRNSDLTVANLVKHNSLISQRERVRTISGSDGSNCLQSAGGMHHAANSCGSSELNAGKKVHKFSGLQKLPPLDLRAARGAQKVSAQSQALKLGKRSPFSDTIPTSESCSAGLNSENNFQPSLQLPQPAVEESSSNTMFLAQSSAPQPLSGSVLTAASKPKKYLTPLQRKRLKMKGETASVVVDASQEHFEKETLVSSTSEYEGHPGMPSAVSVAGLPNKKRASSITARSPAFVGPEALVNPAHLNIDNQSGKFSHPLGGERQSSALPSTGFSVDLPVLRSRTSGFPFPTSFTQPIASFARPTTYNHPRIPAVSLDNMGIFTSFGNLSLSSAPMSSASSSITLGDQTSISASLSAPHVTAAISSSKSDASTHPPSTVSTSAAGITAYRSEITDIGEYVSSRDEPLRRGPPGFSTTAEQVGSTSSCDKNPSKLAVEEPSDSEIVCAVKNPDSAVHEPAESALDDLETIDDTDDFGEFSSENDVSAPSVGSELDPRFDDKDGARCVTLNEHPGHQSNQSSLDLDTLVRNRVSTKGTGLSASDQSQPANTSGRGYGLDEISLTDAHCKGKSQVPVCGEESSEDAESRPVKPDEGWQTVGKAKKSTKKLSQAELDILKFRTQEKYTNLVNLITDIYKQLQRDEVQEVLETVFTSNNQLVGLRQGHILAKVDVVVSEWYPDRSLKTSKDTGEAASMALQEDTNNNKSHLSSQQGGVKRRSSQGFLELCTDTALKRDAEGEQPETGDGTEPSGKPTASIEEDCPVQ